VWEQKYITETGFLKSSIYLGQQCNNFILLKLYLPLYSFMRKKLIKCPNQSMSELLEDLFQL
jgi:hypothetical protein